MLRALRRPVTNRPHSTDTVNAPRIAVFVRADDGRVVSRLRHVAHLGVHVTLFAGSQDPRAERLAAAADAEIGAIAPDAHLPVVLCPDGPPRGQAVDSLALVVPVDDEPGWTVHYPGGATADAVDGGDGEALADALARNVPLGPVGAPPEHRPADLSGLRAIHIASAPATIGAGRLPQTVMAIRSAGTEVEVRTVTDGRSRRSRIRAGWRLVREAAADGPDVIHIHDPELLPAAYVAAVRRRRTIVYDSHADLRNATRRRQWIPRVVRRPVAAFAGRVENLIAARIAGVVTDSAFSAIGFAARGAHAIAVADPARESAKIIAFYARLTGRTT